ncbi:MAG: glutamine amidotransferase [Oxalobacteraceae bacterium]|nr:MAG: glutamine amidotransferase [Oxalobacteraceae bacterium]
MLKTAVAIRHLPFENLGGFEAVLADAGYKTHYYDVGVDDLWTLDPLRTSLIVVLGGSMSVYEGDRWSFLAEEVRFIHDRIGAGRPLLGICLGAQLIAHALGAQVFPGPGKEIGLSPVILTDAGRLSPLSAISPGDEVLHWHGDTFDLPEGAVLLASTSAYHNQAFAFGRNVLALQFHLEAGSGIDSWITGHAEELQNEGIDGDALRRRVHAAAPTMKRAAEKVLRGWLLGLVE